MTKSPAMNKSHLRVIVPAALLLVGAAIFLGPINSAKSASADKPVSRAPHSVLVSAHGSGVLPVMKDRTSKLASNSVQPPFFSETITTYAADCTTPKTSFVVGDTVCVQVTGVPLSLFFPRHLTWSTVDTTIVQSTAITSDPQTDSLLITATSTVGGQTIDNRGVWTLTIRNPFFFFPEAETRFVVTDPANATADLGIDTFLSSDSVGAGSQAIYGLQISNYGPDSAANVTLTDDVPASSTFVSFNQTSGPAFTCTNPTAGSTGTTTCSIASLASGDVATFVATYDVDAGATVGTLIVNNASVASSTSDLRDQNNSTSATATVTSTGGTGTCTLDCPEDINAIANTTENNVRGAHITFDAANATGTCGAVTASPASGSFFAVGTTIVTVTSETGGGSCSFAVSVEDQGANPPVISCPANQTANADSNCSANVAVGTATATGNNVTIFGTRSDGQPMYTCDVNGTNCTRNSTDAPFSTGITTITWIAHSHDVAGPYASEEDEIAHRTGAASCTQTVTVNDVTPPTISAPNLSASADANCLAPVPDYTTIATVSDNCACASSDTSQICDSRQDIKITQSPAAGTLVGLGATTVTLTANDGSSNNGGLGNSTTIQVTFTVNDTTPPAFTFVPPAITAYTGPSATTCDTVVDPGQATATDNCSAVTITRSPSGNTFAVGTTTITWTAKDAAGNTSTATQTITVIDNTPPTITLNGITPSMWPPNHDLHTFRVTDFVTSVFDNCGGVSVGNVVISQVTSDELDDATGGGDGNTINDIQIASDCKSVQLRSERSGNGDGRVYTITFRLTDTHGNVTTATATVVVPHDQGAGPETVVDSGPHYTVNGTCP